MFERTVSFWNRLLRRQPRPEAARAAAVVEEEDRRVWSRYAADIETTCTLACSGEAASLPARVRNISLGGVSLATDRPFEPGSLLSIQLPLTDDHPRATVLACVVHVRDAGGGVWHVGCTFARELSAADLEAFGARRARSGLPDQRSWQRFSCDVKALCQPVAAPGPEPFAATVLNLSPSGVGLLLPCPLETGTLLSVELQAASGAFRKTMLACVVHASARTDGQHALGCNFIRSLSEADLQALR